LPFYLGLLRFPLQQKQGRRGWNQAALIGLSQVMTAAGVLREGVPRAWTDLTSRKLGKSRAEK
jgi:hypothetical protein